ncbi:endolytic transglycosylase MltG [Candidatus Falkowbacteria bacterium]|nr:endolytic transglycosylase MltG [Candidatus Falkowbacteria bacterium]
MKKFVWLSLFIVLPLLLLSSIVFFSWELTRKPAAVADKEIAFTIERGESLRQISQKLYNKGVISSPWFFESLVKLSKKQNKLQAGSYTLPQGRSLMELIATLSNAEANQTEIILKEGEGVRDLAKKLEQGGVMPATSFSLKAGLPTIDYRTAGSEAAQPVDFSQEFVFLKDKPSYYGLEGYLFPDTYRFDKGATAEQVIRKMLVNFDKKLTPDMRSDISKQNKTIWEVVIMASLLEKEVRTAEDMKLVADLFYRRIARGQALQSDATLSYVLNDTIAAHSLADLETDTPYNSYKYKGLPPTPIGNPGLAALSAAIYPTTNDYNFFLSDPATGKTVFAATFEEHKRNKAQYLK